MTLLNEGLNRIRDLMVIDINQGQLGTGTATPSESDTALGSAIPSTLLELDSVTTSDKAIKFVYTLPSTGGETRTYSEFELYSGTATVDYDRVVWTGVSFTKNGSEDLIVTKKYYIRSV